MNTAWNGLFCKVFRQQLNSWNGNSVMCVAIDPRGRTPQFHADKWRLPFKGGFYSRAASIYFSKRIFAASIRGRLLFKGGFYSRKYGIYIYN